MSAEIELTDKELQSVEVDSFTMVSDAIRMGEIRAKKDASKGQ